MIAWALVACRQAEPVMIGSAPIGYENRPVAYQGARPPNVAIVHTIYLELAVADVDNAVNRATTIASDFGGYVISSQTWYDNGQRHETTVLAVPLDFAGSTRQSLLRLGSLIQDRVSETVLSTGQGVPFAQITVQFEPGRPAPIRLPAEQVRPVTLADTFRWVGAMIVSLFQSLANIIMLLAVLAVPVVLILLGVITLLRRPPKG